MIRKSIFLLINRLSNTFQGSFIAKIPGSGVIYNLIYKKIDPKGLILINVKNSRMYVNTNEKGITPYLLQNKSHEDYETKIFENLIKPDTILFDVGANIGYYTLIGANIIKKGKIYSFEPDTDNFQLLIKNIQINNFNNVIPIQKAISNENGRAKIFIDKINLGNHSLAEENVPNKLDALEVQTITLDSFLENLEFEFESVVLKIDTQGAEGLIIEGSQTLLRQDKIKILMEFWPKGLRNMGTEPLKLLEELDAYGFKLKVIDEKEQSLKVMGMNEIINLCENSEKIDQLNLLLEK